MGRSDLQKLLEQKKAAKKALFDACWPGSSTRSPIVIIFSTHEHKNEVYDLLKGMLVLPVHVVVVSDEKADESKKNGATGKLIWVHPENGKNAQKVNEWLMASDMAIIFDEKQSTISALFDRGVVPIGHAKSPLLADYHPNEETGNSFTYSEKNSWGVFAATVRACETFRFPYDWQHIIRGMLKVR